MSSRPFMPLFVGDFLGDTLELSAGDFGRYMLLCMAYWQKGGPLSDDDRALGQITRSSRYVWQKTRKKLASFFTIIDGKWHHKRVDLELAKIKHRNDLRARNEAPRAPASRACVQPHPGEIAPSEQFSTDVESTGPPPDRAAPDRRAGLSLGRDPPRGELFKRGRTLLGKGKEGLVGLMLKSHGLERVELGFLLVEVKRPRSPPAFFRAICEGRQAKPPETVPPPDSGPSRRLTPEEIDAIYGKEAA